MISLEELDSNIRQLASEMFIRASKWTMLLFPTTEIFLSAQFTFIWKEKHMGKHRWPSGDKGVTEFQPLIRMSQSDKSNHVQVSMFRDFSALSWP